MPTQEDQKEKYFILKISANELNGGGTGDYPII